MIVRVFRVEIFPEMVEEFEAKFRSLSVGALENQSGCLSIEVGVPIEHNISEYLMISKWINKRKLIDFLGENWNQAYIPDGMAHLAKQYSVHHYEVTP